MNSSDVASRWFYVELRKKNWKRDDYVSGHYCHGNHDFQWCCHRNQITQTDVDMQSPVRAGCWILIQHTKTIIKATAHQRWDLPPSTIHQSKHSGSHISPTGSTDISYLSFLTGGENQIRMKGFSLSENCSHTSLLFISLQREQIRCTVNQ